MRYLTIALILAAACGKLPGLTLPDAVSFVAAHDADGRFVVVVTDDARVMHAGKSVTLNELAKLVEGNYRVTFHVDAKARWCHVQWALATILEVRGDDTGVVPSSALDVSFSVEWNAKKRSLPVRYAGWVGRDSPSWAGGMFGSYVGIRVDGRHRYRVGTRTAVGLSQLHDLVEQVGALAPPAIYALEPRMQTPTIECLEVLNDFQEAGIEHILCALEEPHVWVRAQNPLPEPRRNHAVIQFMTWQSETNLSQKDIADLSLPLASQGKDDKDDDVDDRLILNLDRLGRILYRDVPRSLDEIGTILSKAKLVYNLKQKAKGQTGYEAVRGGTEYSRLFVLLRADRATRWRQVKWLLAIMEEERLYKLQFAVMTSADLSYTEAEARRAGVRRRDELPWRHDHLDAKLPCIQWRSGPETEWIDIDLGDPKALDLIPALYERVRAPLRQRVMGRITAADEVPLQRVLEAVDRFHKAGIEKIRFAGIEAPPDDVRRGNGVKIESVPK